MKIEFEVKEFEKFLNKLEEIFLSSGDDGLIYLGTHERIENEKNHDFMNDSLRIRLGEVNMYCNLNETKLIKGKIMTSQLEYAYEEIRDKYNDLLEKYNNQTKKFLKDLNKVDICYDVEKNELKKCWKSIQNLIEKWEKRVI